MKTFMILLNKEIMPVIGILDNTDTDPGDSTIENLPTDVGAMDLILGSGRSPGEGISNPLQ